MGHRFLTLLLLATCGLGLNKASAQDLGVADFLIAPGLLYYSGLRSRTSKDEKVYLVGELKMAYQIYPHVFLGPTYQYEQEDSKSAGYSAASLNNTVKSQRNSLGASVGYVASTYHFILTYYLDSKWKLDTTNSTGSSKYEYQGTGVQLDAAYKIPIWGFHFGPQLSYKIFTYEKLSTNGGTAEKISPKLEDSALEPSIVLFYFF